MRGNKKGKKNYINIVFSSIQINCSVLSYSATPWTAARQASLSITNTQSLLRVRSTELVMPSNHLILCSPLLLASIFPNMRVFSNESVLRIRWPNNNKKDIFIHNLFCVELSSSRKICGNPIPQHL